MDEISGKLDKMREDVGGGGGDCCPERQGEPKHGGCCTTAQLSENHTGAYKCSVTLLNLCVKVCMFLAHH